MSILCYILFIRSQSVKQSVFNGRDNTRIYESRQESLQSFERLPHTNPNVTLQWFCESPRNHVSTRAFTCVTAIYTCKYTYYNNLFQGVQSKFSSYFYLAFINSQLMNTERQSCQDVKSFDERVSLPEFKSSFWLLQAKGPRVLSLLASLCFSVLISKIG